MDPNDLKWMEAALAAAREAGSLDEVPIGACIVSADGTLLATVGNRTICDNDPTAHAEILALRQAAHHIGNYRLTGATVYSTIEPCAMCAGALVNARIARLVYAADDERFGAVRTHFRICDSEKLNHRMEIETGLLADEARGLMQDFFQNKRDKRRLQSFGLEQGDPRMAEIERMFTEAMDLRDAEEYVEAIKKLEEILAMVPKRPAGVLGMMAHFYFKLEDFDVALEYSRETVGLSPNSQLASIGLFHTLWMLEKTEEAFAEASRFLELKPDSEEYRLVLEEIGDGCDLLGTEVQTSH